MKEETIKKVFCHRCKYEWFPRIMTQPKTCPRCKSPYWDTPRRKKKNEMV